MPTPPPHFLVFIPGYGGTRLRSRSTGEMVWVDVPGLLRNPFEIKESLDRLWEALAYPNPDLEPAGLLDEVLFLPPLFKQEQYGRMIQALQAMGYQYICDYSQQAGGPANSPDPGSRALYVFDYDWRQDNRISAHQLGQAVRGWMEANPGAQPWLIGHSNGGIVSRWYIEKEGGKDKVGRLFLLGSPWDGAPKAVQVMLDGLEIFFRRSLNLFDISRRSREVVRTFPSFYQLIPYKEAFLRSVENQPVDLFAERSWAGGAAEQAFLADALAFNRDLGTNLSVESLCFFGVKKPTTTGGVLRTGSGGKWSGVTWDRTEAGDGTVPLHSAVHPAAREKLPFPVDHGNIYVDPAVLEKLEWEMLRKYELGVLAEVQVGRFRVQFEPDRDDYQPGETIQTWARVESVAPGQPDEPVLGASIQVQVTWHQALPGDPDPSAPPGPLPFFLLIPSGEDPGRYDGSLTAPARQGYYRLEATVELDGVSPIHLHELILVEGPPGEDTHQAALSSASTGADDTLRGLETVGGAEYSGGAEYGEAEPGRRDREDDPGYQIDFPSPTEVLRGGLEPMEGPAGGVVDFPAGEPVVMRGIPEGFFTPVDPVFAQNQPVPKGLPPMEDSGAASAERFINPSLEDHDSSQPIQVGESFVLAFNVSQEQTIFSTRLSEERLFRTEEHLVEVKCIVTSRDFAVHTREAQTLRLPRTGKSKNKVRFDLELAHALPVEKGGVGEVNAYFYKDNNFIQGLKVRLQTTSGPALFERPEGLGRPVENAAAAQPRDVSLVITQVADGFDVLMVDVTARRAHLPLPPQQVDYLVSDIRKRLRDIVFMYQTPQGGISVLPRGQQAPSGLKLVYQRSLDIPPEVNAEALRRLAEAGWLLFQQLFDAFNPDSEAYRLGAHLVELARQDCLKIQIVSEKFLLPWGLLYMSTEPPDPQNPDPECFLGLRHIVEHIPLQKSRNGLDVQIKSQPQLTVGLNLNPGIDQQFGLSVVRQQLEFWDELKKAGGVQTALRQNRDQFLQALGDPTTPDQILYFYGHAVSQGLGEAGAFGAPAGPAGSALSISDQPIPLNELMLRAPTSRPLVGAPLVFINACESAELSPLFYSGFMPYFVARGARGMIGTECEVPALFAAEWARRFFERFLSGAPLGRTFLDLRRDFYFNHNNLLGLLYALYADGDTRVSPGLQI